jgi:hypothetical protein
MAFAQNADSPDLNIGLFVLECTDDTLAMWSEALRRVRENANLHDQRVVAELCVEPTLLPPHLVVARWPHACDPYRESFLALKIFTPCSEPKCVRDSFRRQAMARYGYTLPPRPDRGTVPVCAVAAGVGQNQSIRSASQRRGSSSTLSRTSSVRSS